MPTHCDKMQPWAVDYFKVAPEHCCPGNGSRLNRNLDHGCTPLTNLALCIMVQEHQGYDDQR